jgi:hypothetical protein
MHPAIERAEDELVLTTILGPGDRLSPCHSVLRALQELPHPPRRRNLCHRPVTELDMRSRSESR